MKYLFVTYYLGVMLLFVSSFFLFMGGAFYFTGHTMLMEWEVLGLSSMSVIMLLLLDWMSLGFVGFVLLISSMVLFYSHYYMYGDKNLYRFILMVYLFVLSMLLMILSPNLISILLGWDGLGLVSYCLVIYYQSVKSSNAGMLTILSNRVGDVAILLSIAWLFNFGSWNLFYVQFFFEFYPLMFLFLMILAGMTKSAQIPFSAWLPAAMAAPTPVSALVHSSTLVTAGVYLLIRFSVTLNFNLTLMYIGALTMFMSGLGANYETDLKKIIALSTLSQLGVMMFILSLGSMELAFFHLLSHALFKSLLFLCAGAFIHGVGDIQDIRLVGSLGGQAPVSSFYFFSCSLSLCGFPFLSGFYSKDLILETYMMGGMGGAMILVVILGTFFTAAYSVRLGLFLFIKNVGVSGGISGLEVAGMMIPMSVLFTVSIFAGSLLSWMNVPCYSILLPIGFKILFLVAMFFFMFYILNYTLGGSVFSHCEVGPKDYFVGGMWFMPLLSTSALMNALSAGSSLFKFLDQGWNEALGGQGAHYYGSHLSSSMDVNLTDLIRVVLVGVLLVLLFFSFFSV